MVDAEFPACLYDNKSGIGCRGSLQRESASGVSIADFLMNSEYASMKISIEEISRYAYLVFYEKRIQTKDNQAYSYMIKTIKWYSIYC